MSRFILVISVWIVFVGGLGLYMYQRNASTGKSIVPIEFKAAERVYTVEITPTFTAEPDPFALQTDEDELAALVLKLGDMELLSGIEQAEKGKTITVENVKGLVIGSNELYLEASPPIDQSDSSHAVRLRLLEDNIPIAEKTFWSENGSKVTGVLHFELKPHTDEDEHHD